MKRRRLTVVAITVLVWGLSALLGMASYDCMTMSAMCVGPCGAHQGVPCGFVSDSAPSQVSLAFAPSVDGVSSASLQIPELPPKSLRHLA